MTVFDQRGQRVTYQYNAAGDINIGAVHNKLDLVGQLEQLREELGRASAAGALTEEVATDAQYRLTKAVQQAKKPEPDRKSILDHVNAVTELVKGVAGTAGLVQALMTAADKIRLLF